MVTTREWRELEQAFQVYWQAINSDKPVDWFEQRKQISDAIAKMEEWTTLEREENDRKAQALSRRGEE